MSSYLHFFIRKDNIFIRIDSFPRSSKVYTLFNNVPYGKIRRLSKEEIKEKNHIAEGYIKLLEENINEAKERQKLIATFSNSIIEKIDMINEYDDAMTEYRNDQEEYSYASHYLEVLLHIYNELEADQTDTDIYCGIEISTPSEKDII